MAFKFTYLNFYTLTPILITHSRGPYCSPSDTHVFYSGPFQAVYSVFRFLNTYLRSPIIWRKKNWLRCVKLHGSFHVDHLFKLSNYTLNRLLLRMTSILLGFTYGILVRLLCNGNMSIVMSWTPINCLG